MSASAGSTTVYTALMERCIGLAREGRFIRRLGRSLSNLSSEVYPHDLVRATQLVSEGVDVSRRPSATATRPRVPW